ncbi:helix-turn-helix domain-containing protein [Achromobacter insuavis]
MRVGQILDAALQEFSAAGYAGARMDDIAARAGLSKGGLYAHFASKEEVFEALLARYLSPPRLDARALVEARPRPGTWPNASSTTCTPAWPIRP